MKTHYSCAELAALKLPGYPTTIKGWFQLVHREDWPFIEGRCKGGRNGGIVKLYELPKNLPSRTKPQIAQAKVVTLDAVRLEFLLTIEEANKVLGFIAELRASRG